MTNTAPAQALLNRLDGVVTSVIDAAAIETDKLGQFPASSLAALIVSAYEGALLQSRVAGNVQAMRDTSAALLDLIRLSLPGRTP